MNRVCFCMDSIQLKAVMYAHMMNQCCMCSSTAARSACILSLSIKGHIDAMHTAVLSDMASSVEQSMTFCKSSDNAHAGTFLKLLLAIAKIPSVNILAVASSVSAVKESTKISSV